MPAKKSKRADVDPYWGWVDDVGSAEQISQDNIRAVYHLHQTPCRAGQCRKNCRQSPFCLNSLGETQWRKSEASALEQSDEDFRRRQKGELVGLRNLGATCYVNAFLQLWFHNLEFRSAVYKWRGEPNLGSQQGDNTLPTTICGMLQYIFVSLQLSEMSVIDPSPLVRKLALDSLEQQDAQEFGKLFINLLGCLPDPSAVNESDPEGSSIRAQYEALKTRIQDIFSGLCQYVTRCKFCNTLSAADSRYYEIDAAIEGKRTLSDALADYFKEEVLDGDNMYLCEVCHVKRAATRRIQLKTLPSVLHVQLMRYVYDRKAGHKKKLSSDIQFPEVLDMNQYLEKNDDPANVYELTAVLLHSGSGAYSGHYTAHIRLEAVDAAKGKNPVDTVTAFQLPSSQHCSNGYAWFKFNDENIQPIASSNLELAKEEHDKPGELKQKKVPKGYLSSKNAYMLVYAKRRDALGPVFKEADIPKDIRDIVEKENTQFIAIVKEIESQTEQKRSAEDAEKMFVLSTYHQLFTPPFYNGNDMQTVRSPVKTAVVSTDWLVKWLKNPQAAGPIDNTAISCRHGKVAIDIASSMKCVDLEGAKVLYDKYGVSPKLDLSMLCTDCVKSKYDFLKMQQKVAKDSLFIHESLKSDGGKPISGGYVVGRDSLRQLKQLMLRPAALSFDSTDSGDATPSLFAGDKPADFNEDIVCPHGLLANDEKQRVYVASELWDVLKRYFPNTPEFSVDSPTCQQCIDKDLALKENAEKNRSAALGLRTVLSDLLANKKRPDIARDLLVYIVSKAFVDSFKHFFSNSKRIAVPKFDDQHLLCTHGKLCAELTDPSTVVYLWPNEWAALHALYNPATVIRTRLSTDGRNYEVEPALCVECLSARIAEQQNQQFTYDSAKVFVCKVKKQKTASANAESNVDAANKVTEHAAAVNDSEAPKRKRKASQHYSDNSDDESGHSKMARTSAVASGDSAVRRSGRRRHARGDKEVFVSSKMTVKELKVELMKLFAVAPFDQTVMLDGRVLSPDEATLQDMHVAPLTVLELHVDELCPEDAQEVEAALVQQGLQKEGFEGTGLLAKL